MATVAKTLQESKRQFLYFSKICKHFSPIFWNHWLLNTLTPCKMSLSQNTVFICKLWNAAQKLKNAAKSHFLQDRDVKVLNLLKSIFFNILQKSNIRNTEFLKFKDFLSDCVFCYCCCFFFFVFFLFFFFIQSVLQLSLLIRTDHISINSINR